jgi:hypothetical protein
VNRIEAELTSQDALILARLKQVTEDLCEELTAGAGWSIEALKIVAANMLAHALALSLTTGTPRDEILAKCERHLDLVASQCVEH